MRNEPASPRWSGAWRLSMLAQVSLLASRQVTRRKWPLVVQSMRTSFLLLLCVAGCGITDSGERGPFRITTDHSSYVYGSKVTVGVRNVSSATQAYNFCPVTLQRVKNGAWITEANFPASGACAAVAYTLAAGDSRWLCVPAPAAALPGRVPAGVAMARRSVAIGGQTCYAGVRGLLPELLVPNRPRLPH
jgi:hypothetical protein